jgi:hypothetical protein
VGSELVFFVYQYQNTSNVDNVQQRRPVLLELPFSPVDSAIFLISRTTDPAFELGEKTFRGEVEADSDDAEEAEADNLNA